MSETLPALRSATSPAWARAALASPLELLNDHAHLERKAAQNALELLHRRPDLPGWGRELARIARDETEHLAVVLRELAARGGAMSRGHRNGYAAGLRALVRAGQGPEELVDRLLVAALIEARSCERFALLAAQSRDAGLRRLYERLEASEAGHHRVFLGLAHAVDVGSAARWDDLLAEEARVLAAQPPGPAMHSGEPGL